MCDAQFPREPAQQHECGDGHADGIVVAAVAVRTVVPHQYIADTTLCRHASHTARGSRDFDGELHTKPLVDLWDIEGIW